MFPISPKAAGLLLLLSILVAAPAAMARSAASANDGLQRYIIEFRDPPLALYEGRQAQASSQLESSGGAAAKAARPPKLDLQATANRNYLGFIEARQEDFKREAAGLLGRQMRAVHSYRVAANGMAVDLTPAEAAALAGSPQLKSIRPDVRYRLDTDAGPEWIGAGAVWDGSAGFPEAQGEGIVVGVIDSGVNWEHPSFEDPSLDGYAHSNPLGSPLGLCDDPEVSCNNKLIGVYDFVEDDPSTGDVVEENTKGRDTDGHGSHVASIAVGNRLNVFLNGNADATLSGVAPRANLVAYRVCYVGEPIGPDSGGCMGSAILAAIDQAIEDGVDVINYSIGSEADNPWDSTISSAFLGARGAGLFVATSAGNDGPNPGTVGAPANAPWILAAGNATHNRLFGSVVRNLSGGDTTPPGELVGASLTGGTGKLNIVHARDYGFALCGEGEPELEAACEDNEGLTNPWAGQRPFNGEIVVCDRGTYGRVEKGKNVMLAGAGGYILANTGEFGESIVSDEHCLPASHIGLQDGDALRSWLATGSGHGGSISGFTLAELDRFGDQVNQSSARGPATEPVEDTLKPNLIAPGTSILAASDQGQEFRTLTGTSMASPHVAGAAALLKSVHPDWNPSQLASAIETTTTAELATVEGLYPANPRERGAGRPQLGEAANAGIYLNVTASQFSQANPSAGGDPGSLNLPGLVESRCQRSCTFSRRVTDQMGGGSWTAAAIDFPAGVEVSVTPSSFNLANGGSQTLAVSVDLEQSGIVGEWIDGRIRLSAAGSPDQFLTVSVFAYGGTLPAGWFITDDHNGGWKLNTLSGLAAMPDASFQSGGLQAAEQTSEVLLEDPTNSDPYDGGEGVFTTWHALPQGGLWLHAETLQSTAEDLDLFVGRDDNGNGVAEAFEELCSSITPQDLERCNLYDLEAGDYWIVVQNWTGTEPAGDEASLLSFAIAPGAGNNLAVSGPGIIAADEAFDLRLSWDNVSALPGETWFGAVGIGTHRDQPNNIGVIPVRFNRSGIAQPATLPLFDGVAHQLALGSGGEHDRMFIDVPPGAGSLTVSARRLDEQSNTSLALELRRLDFDSALADPPFAAAPTDAQVIVSDSGSGDTGPTVTVSNPQTGRWYAVLSNGQFAPRAPVEIRADVAVDGTALTIHRGLWEPNSRPGLGQGFDYNWGGVDRALIWYTYDESGQPAWYIAGSPAAAGNIWNAPLYRVTNDGAQQQLATVGRVAVTMLAENDALFTFTLFGESGTDRMQPLSPLTCPQVDGSERSYTGIWYRGLDGLGGASVVMNAQTQAQIHYLFDGVGAPRWLVAQDLQQPAPTHPELPMLQFTGYCAVCSASGVSYAPTGVLTREFGSETTGSWTLDYLFQAPLSGSVQRTDQIIKLTDTLDCL
jgi:subtilisin family serine protease